MKTKKEILLVEDTKDVLINLSEYLVMEGYHVVPARNGLEAVARLNIHLPDIILTDLLMPELDGFGLIEEIKKDPRWQRIPVVVFSARPLNAAEIQRLGVKRVLLKPCKPEVIVDAITAFC